MKVCYNDGDIIVLCCLVFWDHYLYLQLHNCDVLVVCVVGWNYRYDETLVVPIVENTPEERDLKVKSAYYVVLCHYLL